MIFAKIIDSTTYILVNEYGDNVDIKGLVTMQLSIRRGSAADSGFPKYEGPTNMPAPRLDHVGPVVEVSPTLQRQACLVHAETMDMSIAIGATPGGSGAGWWVPPVWQNSVDGESFAKLNPKLNSRGMRVWLFVRDIQNG